MDEKKQAVLNPTPSQSNVTGPSDGSPADGKPDNPPQDVPTEKPEPSSLSEPSTPGPTSPTAEQPSPPPSPAGGTDIPPPPPSGTPAAPSPPLPPMPGEEPETPGPEKPKQEPPAPEEEPEEPGGGDGPAVSAEDLEDGTSLPPVITPPEKPKFPVKKVGGIVAVLLLLVALPVGVFLVQQKQQVEVPAFNAGDCSGARGSLVETTEDCDCGRNQPDGELVQVFVCSNGDRLPGSPTGRSCKEKGIICQGAAAPPPDVPSCNSNNCEGKPGTKPNTVFKCHSDNRSEKDNIPGCYMECKPGYRWVDGYSRCEKIPEGGVAGAGAFTCTASGTSIEVKNQTGSPVRFDVQEFRGCRFPGDPPGACQGGQYKTRFSAEGLDPGQTRTYSMDGAGPCEVVQLDVTNCGSPWHGGVAFIISSNSNCAPPSPSPPPPTAECRNIKIYDAAGNEITTDALTPGQSIQFAVAGTSSGGGTITRARFRVNKGAWRETTLKNSKGEFFLNTNASSSAGSFSVEAMVFSPEIGWR